MALARLSVVLILLLRLSVVLVRSLGFVVVLESVEALEFAEVSESGASEQQDVDWSVDRSAETTLQCDLQRINIYSSK